MAADNQLQIGAIIDLGQLQAGMGEAQAVVAASTQGMKASFSGAADSAENASRRMAEGMSEGFDKAEARATGHFLGLNRHLTNFVGQLPGVGQAMALAFSGIAIFELVELVIKAGEKVYDFIESLHELSEEEKAALKTEADEAKKADEFYRRILEIRRQTALIGLTDVQQAALKAQWAKDDALESGKKLEYEKKLYDQAKKTIELYESGATKTVKVPNRFTGLEDQDVPLVSDDEVKKAKAVVQELEDVYGQGLKELANQVTINEEKQAQTEAQSHQKRLEAHKKFLEQRRKLDETIAKSKAELQKQQDKELSDENKILDENLQRQLKDELKAAEDKLKLLEIQRKAYEAELEGEVQASKSAYELKKQQLDAELSLGVINSKKHLQLLKQAEDQEYKAELDALNKKLLLLSTLDPDYPVQRQKILNEIDKLEQQHRLNAAKLDQQSLANRKKQWDNFFGAIGRGFSGTIQGMIQGTQTFAQGMANMFNNILASFADMLVQMVLRWVENWLFMKIFGQTTQAETAVSQVTSNAAVAGAAGVASFAAAPWPIDMGAPAFGASMMSAALAYAPLASMAGGAVVPHDMLANVHKDEMMLPAHISKPLQAALAGGGFGGQHVHLHSSVNVTAMDGKSVERVFTENGDALGRVAVKKLERAIKNGAFRGKF